MGWGWYTRGRGRPLMRSGCYGCCCSPAACYPSRPNQKPGRMAMTMMMVVVVCCCFFSSFLLSWIRDISLRRRYQQEKWAKEAKTEGDDDDDDEDSSQQKQEKNSKQPPPQGEINSKSGSLGDSGMHNAADWILPLKRISRKQQQKTRKKQGKQRQRDRDACYAMPCPVLSCPPPARRPIPVQRCPVLIGPMHGPLCTVDSRRLPWDFRFWP
ncbi:hypothetical protein MGYG_08935 [Nannizzia gypsea CBS 118893]|uniref:Uncharacterized protein n=1 Tax=Arthroderma gypseum (strain ATCC MYA-4604 / CBS 118893) TaxID=535722 RepID=E5R0Z6_ARTGP|nr:hypothetical protein MGYG_08935 [Nannizzia gypsea CBS 118893]EFQ98438.1 hypothetical protein MGYG_08935 [Nannizzia gypsea CBS 118893]